MFDLITLIQASFIWDATWQLSYLLRQSLLFQGHITKVCTEQMMCSIYIVQGGQKGGLTLLDLDPVGFSQPGTAVGVMTPLSSWDNWCQHDSSLTASNAFFKTHNGSIAHQDVNCRICLA